jgi:hypothetical protein
MAVDTNQPIEQLLPHVMKFVGSSGGGQWAFHLLCSVPKCRRIDTISASARTIKSERYRVKACEKFISSGWGMQDGPICPACRRAEAE